MHRHDDLNDHPFSFSNVAFESGASNVTAWDRWVDAAEKLLDVNLSCCCDDEDGCSLDQAYDAFAKRWTPGAYAKSVRR